MCKILDYGKYRYELAQRDKESRKKSTNIVIKEMKYRPKIGGGDFDTKTRKVAEFLGEGHKVKITIMFRGREQHRPELGFRLLQKLAEDVTELGFVESSPKQDGRNMTMVLGPHKKKSEAKAEVKAAKEEKAAARSAERDEDRHERAERNAKQATAPKKERRRSENLDPDIDL